MHKKWTLFLLILGGLLTLSVFVALSFGTTDLGLRELYTVLTSPENEMQMERAILLDFRFPRLVLAMLVGGGLAVAGATLQGLFRNPMASPGILGFSAGAGLIAVVVIHMGDDWGPWALPLGAFLGALTVAFVVYGISTRAGTTSIPVLLLVGVAISALCISITTFVMTLANIYSMQTMVFWLMGGVEIASWEEVRWAAFPIVAGTTIILGFARQLNTMTMGEEVAATLGTETQRLKQILLVLTAVLTGASVAVAGSIGFVGLIVPHMIRLITGPDYRILIPASFLGGAIFLIWADLIARVVARPQEVKLGVITSFIGVPFFIFLLLKNRKQIGGL